MRIILFFILINSHALFASMLVEEISIRVGDQYPLRYDDEVFLSASKRGVVDIFSVSAKHYKVIALKPGFVSVLVSKNNSESRVLITVEAKKKIPKKSRFTHKFKVETVVEIFNKSHLSSNGRRQLTRINYHDLKSGAYHKSRVGRFYSQVIVQENKTASMELAFHHQQRREDAVLSRTHMQQGFKSFIRIEKSSNPRYFLCDIKVNRSDKGGNDVSDQQRQLMRTSVNLKLNKFHPVGQIDLNSKEKSLMSSDWFSKIPILGPLFKLVEVSRSQILTVYFVKLSLLKD